MNASERIGWLMFRYMRQELTPAEEKELSAWRNASPRNEEDFQEEADFAKLRVKIAVAFRDKDEILARIKASYSKPWQEPVKIELSFRYKFIRAALIVVVVAALVFFGVARYGMYVGSKRQILDSAGNSAMRAAFEGVSDINEDMHRGYLAGSQGVKWGRDEKGDIVFYATSDTEADKRACDVLYTSVGHKFHLKLPDSTAIWFNQSTAIRYPANFPLDSVLLFVEGEAYIEMPSNSSVMYDISLEAATILPNGSPSIKPDPLADKISMLIKTRGSKLNLKAIGKDSLMEVTIKEGAAHIAVKLDAAKPVAHFDLLPGQQLKLVGSKAVLIPQVDMKQVISWRK